MSIMMKGRGTASLAVVAAVALMFALPATAQTAQDDFHRAYYLQHEKGDLQGALALYKQVAESRRASRELRAKAAQHARDLAEEIASGDFTRLVPADTICYLELNRPGAQMRNLLGQLGLLGGPEGTNGGTAFGISPKLVDAVLGMRGAAVAVTDFDARRGPTNGVIILHPGNLDVAQGVLETVLPVGGQPVAPIAGHATYSIEGQVLLTRTSRLLIASPDRAQIEGVLARLGGRGGAAFADNDELSAAMKLRGDDLLFFCMHFKPLMPMVRDVIQRETRRDPELRAALAFLDIESTRCIAGRAGIDADGISFDARLVLDEGHRNLVFNLLRQPGIPKSALSMVPKGAAGFVVGAVNRRGPVPPGVTDAHERPVVTLMDFGRELFANLTDFSLYVMPQVARMPWGPMPDVAVALHVNDPKRSRALWQFVLGTAQAATGGDRTAARATQVGDVRIERYQIEEVPVFLATYGNDLIIAPSERVITASVGARSKGQTLLQDTAYTRAREQFKKDSVRVAALNIGRVCEIASHFMSERERREMAPFAKMLHDSSVSFSIEQGANHMGVSGRICGIPNIGPMVKQLIEQEMKRGRRASASATLRGQFETLHARGRHDAARKVVIQIHKAGKGQPDDLNTFAWQLLTERRYKDKYDDLALAMSKTSNESSAWKNWYYVDTYAMALFKKGDVKKAVTYQRRAVQLAGNHPRVGEAKKRLEQFLAASRKPTGESPRRIR
ncbi:MAG: hypothetical protein ACYTGW_07545 [Planctomycetota bacterium]|jgi:tetratricopeptide (TPR) repeat protein